MIGVIDAGLGNIGSLLNLLAHIGAPAVAVTTPAQVESARGFILPGVGAFDQGMGRLHASGLIPALEHRVLRDRAPLLGVCLGLQLLGRASEEGKLPGLAWVPATTRKFVFPPGTPPLRLPHMGWNDCRPTPAASLVVNGPETPRYYFVHSYHIACDDPGLVAAWTHYGYDFPSAIEHGNIHAVQFHPEKSHRWGKTLLQRFVALT